ncbi:SpoIIE family protein phosphatase [Mycobacterium paraterrae]|uniref:histidine kinase n=1 Tax=Mycobacterium paraterrae TaxID=577492 RepID=A0ABY3VHT1_9MYCO|nr:SpoIIE family protein phosphatase [Mycobacterium paraterrae]UMB68980.1 SpoIIE family protein phosphatase [Mycobacterium paraterrae]
MSGHERRGWPRDERLLPPDLAAAVELGGEMGRRFAEFDWTAHPLGSPQSWPTEMRSAVAMLLTSSFPMVLWLDTDELFLIYNDAYIPILADRHPAALGQRGQYAWWDVWEPVRPMLAGVIDTGIATWSYDLMLPIVTEGRRRERYFTFTYSPLVRADGTTFGLMCPSFETTERVLSERRLQLLNEVAAAVMDTNTIDDAVQAAVAVCANRPDVPFVAMYVGDPEASDVTLRAATPSVLPLLPPTLAALTKSQDLPRTRAETRVIDDVAALIDGVQDVLGAECPDHALLLPLGEGSAAGALLVGTNPLCVLDEQYLGFCQLLADQLTSAMASAVSYEQQRRRADALAELGHAKTAFLTNVSHEFRTPLTLLLGPLDDALAATTPESVMANRLSTARRNAGRLQRLVDSLLDFSRIEAGRATAELVCTDVGALTAHIASSFAELCQRANLDLVLDCQPVLADVDPGLWETVILNLMSNAVKYTLSGSIKVTTHNDKAFCRITVRDTGVGISRADLKRLGERFFRADGTHGRSVEGTGIGLSLVQGLVDLHHGTVEFESEPGRGTAVTIRLPRSAADTPVAHSSSALLENPYVIEADQWVGPRPGASDLQPAPDGRELVLVADDNADMRAHLHRVLSPRWRTVLVHDGQKALEAIRALRPDIVITDVMMPRLDGFELVEEIRADSALASTPVLMLSARAGADAVSEGFASGADDYLPKPFRSQDLIDRVAARLAAKARERDSRRTSDARAQQALYFAQLEAALQGADTGAAIVAALQGAEFVPGEPPTICLGLLDEEAKNLRFEYGAPVAPEIRDRYHIASMDTPIVPVDVVRSGQPMVITDTLNLSSRYRHVVGETSNAVRSCISQPLRGMDGKIVGSLGMLWPRPREFQPAEIDWAAHVARITQSAVDRIRSVQREHQIAVDFQDHLLDLDHGSTAAVVAAVYQPGGEAMRVGGDWYLVMPLEQQGRIAISVGDVVGHGLPAAIAMSRLRAGVAASALTDADPGAVLGNLDRYAAKVPGARCATVSYAVIDDGSDPDTGDGVARISYSCAGHPYPLLVAPGQPPVFLSDGRRPPVAAWESPLKQNTAVHELPSGSVILLYTDGLIERPGEPLDDGFARLQGAAAYRADLPVGDLCDELLERMAPDGGYTDDVVLLALRPCHSSDRSFATVVAASLDNIADARHRMRDWLSGLDVDPRRESDILLATGEAVTNAIEHGCGGDGTMTVSIEAFVRGRTVTATVTDAGQWSGDSSASQRSQERGRGLTMINGLADDAKTVRTAAGTRVTLTFEEAVLPEDGLVEGMTS